MTIENRQSPIENGVACPACNYDCRGLTRCPECGLDLTNPNLILTHTVPWANRKTLGHLPAFARTIYQTFRYPFRQADAAYVPQNDRDARSFAWVCIVISAPVAALATLLGSGGFVASFRDSLRIASRSGNILVFNSGYTTEFLLPAFMGTNIWTAAAAVALFTLIYPWSLTTPFSILRDHGQTTERAVRCAALTRYLAAGFLPLSAGYTFLLLVPSSGLFQILLLPEARRHLLLPALLLVALGIIPLLIYPLILFRRAGAEFWQVALAALIYLIQLILIAALAYAAAIHLTGLAIAYRELWR